MKKIKNIYYLIIILLLSSIVYYFLKNNYIYDSYKAYLTNLKNEFHKLRDLGLDIRNYDIYQIKEIDKKHIIDVPNVRKNGEGDIFKNKNAIGILLHNHIVLDFDSKDTIIESYEIIRKQLPQDTVIEKTPHGYHYYFENDLNIDIFSYVQITINNKKYPIDILGKNNIVTMTPTRINNKEYYWLNSPYTHQFVKLSNCSWIINHTDNKIYSKPYHKLNIKNAFIIINNFSLETEIIYHVSEYTNTDMKLKFLNGTIYNFDNNYYFFTNDSFKKNTNKKYIYNKLFTILKQLNSSCIINLSVSCSNEFIRNSIIQINNCTLHKNFLDYKKDTDKKYFRDYIKTNYLLINTNKNIENNVTINELHDAKNDLLKEKNTYCDESVYLTILLSNKLQIPSACFSIIINHDELHKKLDNETRNEISYFFYSLF